MLVNRVSPINIGAVCIAEIDSRFFLLVELESPNMEQLVIFRITQAQATSLINSGVMVCRIVNEIPEPTPGTEVTFLCSFVVGSQVFLVFDVENAEDELVLVRSNICQVM